MRKIVLILFCLICFICCEISFSQFEQNKLDSALSLALKCMKLTKEDLSLRNDYVEVDSFRLSIIDSLMKDNLKMISTAQDLSQKYQDSLNIQQSVFQALSLLDQSFEKINHYRKGVDSVLQDTTLISGWLGKFLLDAILKGIFEDKKVLSKHMSNVLANIH